MKFKFSIKDLDVDVELEGVDEFEAYLQKAFDVLQERMPNFEESLEVGLSTEEEPVDRGFTLLDTGEFVEEENCCSNQGSYWDEVEDCDDEDEDEEYDSSNPIDRMVSDWFVRTYLNDSVYEPEEVEPSTPETRGFKLIPVEEVQDAEEETEEATEEVEEAPVVGEVPVQAPKRRGFTLRITEDELEDIKVEEEPEVINVGPAIKLNEVEEKEEDPMLSLLKKLFNQK